jgi:hypothetical protein
VPGVADRVVLAASRPTHLPRVATGCAPLAPFMLHP